MECLELESLIGAPMQFDPRFWGFKLEEQRAGTTFTICIETFNCYFLLCPYRDSDIRLFSFEESMGSWFESELCVKYTRNALLQKLRSTCKIDCVEGISK